MAAAAHAFGQRDAVEIRARAQAAFGALGAGAPHQRKGAALLGQDIAYLAVEHARGVDHQAGHAVEHQRLRAFSDVAAQLEVLLIHRAATGHEGAQLLGAEGRNLGPTLKAARLHVQCRQKGPTLGVLPAPDVAVFNVQHQRGDRVLGEEELPSQACAGLVHVEVHHAAGALVAVELFSGALVVVQQHQLVGLGFNGAQQLGAKGKVKDVDGAASQRPQVVHGLDFAVVQAAKLCVAGEEQPGRQRRAIAIGAVASVVEDEGLGIVDVGSYRQRKVGQKFHAAIFRQAQYLRAARYCAVA